MGNLSTSAKTTAFVTIYFLTLYFNQTKVTSLIMLYVEIRTTENVRLTGEWDNMYDLLQTVISLVKRGLKRKTT